METAQPPHEIVLLGAGHTHAHIIRMWRRQRPRDVRLTCVSDFPIATYSGMLPGTLAGLYAREQMEIDLVRLCAWAGVRFLRAEATGLDRQRHEVLFDDHPALRFDTLSIGIGSIPGGRDALACNTDADGMSGPVAIKPMQTFIERLGRRLRRAAEQAADRRLRVAVVGAGVAGIEIVLALTPHIEEFLGQVPRLILIDRHRRIARGLPDGAARLAERALHARGVELILEQGVHSIREGELELSDGRRLGADVVLWATGAEAPPLLRRLGLPTDDAGFLRTLSTLQSVTEESIFAVGDSGTIDDCPTPKAGVYAVRQGPVLWKNLLRRLDGRALVEYRPQRSFLKLLSTGDTRAIVVYDRVSASGRWCWLLKDWIDRRFVARYQPRHAPRP
jgi:selenide, water dikinase